MNGIKKVSRLIFRGEWGFVAGGTEYIRGGLKFRARLNILAHRGLNLLRLPYCFGVPYSISIEPSSVCNLRCPACPAGLKLTGRNPSLLGFEDFKKTIDMIGDYLVRILLWNWGEPFLNPEVYRMIEYAKSKGIIIITSTNGHFFDTDEKVEKLLSSGLDNLIFSVDGTTQEAYERYRVGGNLEKVLNGIKRITQAKRNSGQSAPITNLRFMINAYNENQLEEFKRLADDIGTDICSFRIIYTGLAKQPEKCTDLTPKNEKFVFKKADANTGKCMLFWYMPVLYSNGKIGMCKMDALGEAEIMPISKAGSFGQIWNGKLARGYRKNVRKDSNYSFCKDCFCSEPEFENVNLEITFDKDGSQSKKILRNRYDSD